MEGREVRRAEHTARSDRLQSTAYLRNDVLPAESSHAGLPQHDECCDFRSPFEKAEYGAQGGDARIGEAVTEALGLACFQRGELHSGQLLEVGNGSKLPIVSDDGHAVARDMHVDFNE